jgi:hypothetical protein
MGGMKCVPLLCCMRRVDARGCAAPCLAQHSPSSSDAEGRSRASRMLGGEPVLYWSSGAGKQCSSVVHHCFSVMHVCTAANAFQPVSAGIALLVWSGAGMQSVHGRC